MGRRRGRGSGAPTQSEPPTASRAQTPPPPTLPTLPRSLQSELWREEQREPSSLHSSKRPTPPPKVKVQPGPQLPATPAPPAPPPAAAVTSPPPSSIECRQRATGLRDALKKYRDSSKTLRDGQEYAAKLFNVKLELGLYDVYMDKFRISANDDHHRCSECGDAVDKHRDVPTLNSLMAWLLQPNSKVVPRRIGRRQFDAKLHVIITDLLKFDVNDKVKRMSATTEVGQASTTWEMQHSTAGSLQSSSGTGKTWVTLTAKCGNMRHQKAAGQSNAYELFSLYLGFNNDLELVQKERDLMRDFGEDGVRRAIYARLLILLGPILVAANVHKNLTFLDYDQHDAQVQPTFQRDADYDEWLKSGDSEPELLKNRITDKLEELYSCTMKSGSRLVVLTVVDEVQKLDECIKPSDNGGGACFALRVLRELQYHVYRETKGKVLVMPIGTGINGVVSLGSDKTNGRNVHFGLQKDEAVIAPVDFKDLVTRYCAGCAVTALIPPTERMKQVAAAYCYPVVRETLICLESLCTKTLADFTFPTCAVDLVGVKATPMLIVVATIEETPLAPTDFSLITALPVVNTDESIILKPSLLYWPSLHLAVVEQKRIESAARGESHYVYHYDIDRVIPPPATILQSVVDALAFEGRFFHVIEYFLWLFGPCLKDIPKFLQKAKPLAKWLPDPTEPFFLVGGFKLCSAPNDEYTVALPFLCEVRQQLNNAKGLAKINEKRGPTKQLSLARICKSIKFQVTQQATLKYLDALNIQEFMEERPSVNRWSALFIYSGGVASFDYTLILWKRATAKAAPHIRLRFCDSKTKEKHKAHLEKAVFAEMQRKAVELHAAYNREFKGWWPGTVVDDLRPADPEISGLTPHALICTNATCGDEALGPHNFNWPPFSMMLFACASDEPSEKETTAPTAPDGGPGQT